MPPSLINKVRLFCEDESFEREFEQFARDNYDVFEPLAQMGKNDEQPVEFYDVYNQYLAKFETRIEEFVIKEGYSPKDFFEECKRVLDDEDLIGTEKFFIEFLLASSEYESFIMLMRGEVMSISRERSKK